MCGVHLHGIVDEIANAHTIQNRTYSSDIFVLFDLAAINAQSLLVDVFSFVLLVRCFFSTFASYVVFTV